MEKETADILLQLFTALTNWSHSHWEKLKAMELVLDSHPEIRQEYQQKLSRVRQTGAAQSNHQSIATALDSLRAKLLQV